MNRIAYNEDNWLFFNQPFQTHDISLDDIKYLLSCAEMDDRWLCELQNSVNDENGNLYNKSDFVMQDIQIRNARGTIIQFPFGDRIITFGCKRQLFRGENQDFSCSVPSLRRKTIGKSRIEEEILRTIANMRIWQFAKLISKINVVPYWEAKLGDVNYKALAQHYGFDTYLLDLTNDFRVALFFACCKYDPENDTFRPLNANDINNQNKYGVIYHTPDWVLDFINPGGMSTWIFNHMNDDKNTRYGLDNGDLDGMAFQIGYQPLMRCHHQSGYIYPLRFGKPLNEDRRFERLRFTQSIELSEIVFQMMDGGKKVFPQEGITELHDVLMEIQNNKNFSHDDLLLAYDIDLIDKTLFPSYSDMQKALENCGYSISDCEVEYTLDPVKLQAVNSQYDGKNLLEPIGGKLHVKPEDKNYRDARCIEIYGRLI